jgi:hypothetical protein
VPLDVIVKVAVAAAGAYGGLMLLVFFCSALPFENNEAPGGVRTRITRRREDF